ncbi:MAG: 50S ribosomal protein L6 [Treponema sp.]|jgi:large subunit ribosomal protein L6|nr:50S ribosomal protein L6 [Treponema sp.]
MSKIGKLPVEIPAGVTVTVQPDSVAVKGPKGELKEHVNGYVKVEVKDSTVIVNPTDDSKAAGAAHGLYRALIHNMVIGVTKGFTKTLVITGVGYRAEVQGKLLVMNLGFSSDYVAAIPDGLTVTADAQGKVTITGASKQLVGEFSSQIRSLRKPEPYKGKGIRYEDEVIRRKVGKTGVK